jgi:hypothetical protein
MHGEFSSIENFVISNLLKFADFYRNGSELLLPDDMAKLYSQSGKTTFFRDEFLPHMRRAFCNCKYDGMFSKPKLLYLIGEAEQKADENLQRLEEHSRLIIQPRYRRAANG